MSHRPLIYESTVQYTHDTQALNSTCFKYEISKHFPSMNWHS